MADARSRLELVSDLSQAELLNLGQVGPRQTRPSSPLQLVIFTWP